MLYLSNYINSFSKEFYTSMQGFQKIPLERKILIIALSVINGLSTLFLLKVGGYATFKSLVDVFKAQSKSCDPTAYRCEMYVKELHFQTLMICTSSPSMHAEYELNDYNPNIEELKSYCGAKEAVIIEKLQALGLQNGTIKTCQVRFFTKSESMPVCCIGTAEIEKHKLGFKLKVPWPPIIRMEYGYGWPNQKDQGFVEFDIAVRLSSGESIEKKIARFLEDLSLTFPVWYEFVNKVIAFGEKDGFANYLKSTSAWKSEVEGPQIELIPLQKESLIGFEVHLDKDRNVVFHLKTVSFDFKKEKSNDKRLSVRFHVLENLKFILTPDQKFTFDYIWQVIKLRIDEKFKEFLVEALSDSPSDDSFEEDIYFLEEMLEIDEM